MAKKQATKTTTSSSEIDDLAKDVLAVINKKFKEYPNAAGFLSDANLVTDWVSTGCDMLDLAISNRPKAGVPFGIIMEMSALPGVGKSLLAAHILAETQKMGGIGVLFDTEKAVGMLDFWLSVGVDPQKLIYLDKVRALEDIYDTIETTIGKIISTNKDGPVTIVVDSVMGATTNKELEADFDTKGYATAKALINSIAMRKLPSLLIGRKINIVLINQLRSNMNAGMFADPYCVDPFTTKIKVRYRV